MNGSYTCDCPDGIYEGPTCEVDVDNCLEAKCLNGMCFKIENAQKFLELGINFQFTIFFLLGGTCLDGIGNYTCLCVEGFGDQNCSTDISMFYFFVLK